MMDRTTVKNITFHFRQFSHRLRVICKKPKQPPNIKCFMMIPCAGLTNLSSPQKISFDLVNQGIIKFSTDLYGELAKSQPGNVFVSPLSAQIVLALVYTGAKGDTANEISNILSFPEKTEDLFTGFNCLLKGLENPVLNMANQIFVDSKVSLSKDFQKNAKTHFLASAQSVGFLKNPEASRKQINNWVEKQTKKKILNILPPDSIPPETRMVLINAIHFKDNWVHKFQEAATKEMPFRESKSKSTPVQMMEIQEEFGFLYDKDLKAKILDLEYESRKFHMLVVLPDEIEGLAKLEAALEIVDLVGKFSDMEVVPVKVQLPKFTMEETMDLNSILKALGVQTMFNGQTSDFSGMCKDKGLVVSKVAQKVFLEVNEKGTEAAVATGVTGNMSLPPRPEPKVFIADHPFLFLILHNETPVFIGRFNKPI